MIDEIANIDDRVWYNLNNKRAIQQELVDQMTKKKPKAKAMTPEQLQLTIKDQENFIEGKQKQIDHLNERLSDTQGALTGATKIAERAQKEAEMYRNERDSLRIDLQRALGYIDRVNEDSAPIDPIIEPARVHQRSRGPQMNGMALMAAGCEQSNYGMNDIRGRNRY